MHNYVTSIVTQVARDQTNNNKNFKKRRDRTSSQWCLRRSFLSGSREQSPSRRWSRRLRSPRSDSEPKRRSPGVRFLYTIDAPHRYLHTYENRVLMQTEVFGWRRRRIRCGRPIHPGVSSSGSELTSRGAEIESVPPSVSPWQSPLPVFCMNATASS